MFQRHSVFFLAGAALATAPLAAVAQKPGADAWPSRTVRVVVPYAPGGGNDILARTVVTKAIADLGQNTVVDNRP
ncbi:MAG: tripartite tricarboxylate transporter substrate binding protein, partial [Burkholderiales bacterium]